MQCYVKFAPGTRVTVETPSHATLGASRASVPAPLQSRTVRLADIAAAAAAGAGAVDNRLWQFRARVVSVNTLAVRWGCKFCGSDAGSMGAASAELAETSMRTHRRARAGVDDVEGIGAVLDVEGIGAVLAGCGECRPRSASAAARAALAAATTGLLAASAFVTLSCSGFTFASASLTAFSALLICDRSLVRADCSSVALA